MGDPIPGPHDWMVEWFEAWKNYYRRFLRAVSTKHHQPNGRVGIA